MECKQRWRSSLKQVLKDIKTTLNGPQDVGLIDRLMDLIEDDQFPTTVNVQQVAHQRLIDQAYRTGYQHGFQHGLHTAIGSAHNEQWLQDSLNIRMDA